MRRLDVLFVGLDLEVDLRVDTRVEVVVGDDGLGLRLDQRLADVDLVHAFDARDDDVKPRAGEADVLAQPLDQTAVRGPDDADAQEDERRDDDDEGADDDPDEHGPSRPGGRPPFTRRISLPC